MPTKTYPVWKDQRVELGWFVGSKKIDRVTPITWNERVTNLKSAQADLIARPDGSLTKVVLYVNGSRISELYWGPKEVTQKAITTDISGIIRNGDNLFELSCEKTNPVAFPPTGFLISVNAVLNYEGAEPAFGWLERLAVPIAVLVGTVIFIIGVTRK